MKTYTFIFFFLIAIIAGCHKPVDPVPQSLFVKLFPNDSAYKTGGSFQLADGNYIIYGLDPDNGGILPIVIKTDQRGKILWQKKLSYLFHYVTIKAALDGNMIAVGTENLEAADNINVCRISSDSGKIFSLSQHLIDSVMVSKDYLPDFYEKNNEDLIIAGYGKDKSSSDQRVEPFILHITKDGIVVAFEKYIQEPQWRLNTTSICPNGEGYSICGTASKPVLRYKGFFYFEVNADLKLISDTIVYDSTQTLSAAAMVEQSAGGSVIICGSAGGLNLSGKLYTIKVDEDGLFEPMIYYSDYEKLGRFSKISRTAHSDGGYILSATVNKIDGGVFVSYTKIYLLKLGADGQVQWFRQFDSANPFTSVSVIQTTDGGYLVSGYEHTASYVFTMLMIKTDPSGNIIPEL